MTSVTEREEYLEKLREVHEFPGMFTFKIIGKNDAALEAGALAAIRSMFPEVNPSLTKRESSKGRHVSLTIEVLVPDAESVAALYARFNELPGLHMLM